MSPLPWLSRRSLRIYLAPQQLVLAAVNGERVTGVAALPVANPGGHWEAPLARLLGLLGQPGGCADRAVLEAIAMGAPLSVSLAGRWCQYLMAPWSDALLAEPAANRFLQMQLSAVYGDAARGWSLACDDVPYGQPRAVCGIDSALLHALRSGLGKRCTAIEPVLGTVSRMAAATEALAIVEPGRLTMAAMAQGRLAAICTQPCGGAWPVELAHAWRRWALRTPELDDIARVPVIRLDGQSGADRALPAPFELTDTPFGPADALLANVLLTDTPGAPSASDAQQEAACA